MTELKSFGKPAQEIVDVMVAVMYLMSPKSGLVKDVSWNAAKKAMANVDRFLDLLINFDKDHIPPANLTAVAPYVKDPNFNGEFLKIKSQAAAGICEWVRNIYIYDGVRDFSPL